MKTMECIHCETLFDCKGKLTRKPCLNFKPRKKESEESFDSVLQKELGKVKEDGHTDN